MSTQPNDGGPAFPWRHMDRDSMGQEVTREQGEGMTLRDYFASGALQGYLAGRENPTREMAPGDMHHVNVAKACYRYADAMIVVGRGLA